jgi:hypothetical protein
MTTKTPTARIDTGQHTKQTTGQSTKRQNTASAAKT